MRTTVIALALLVTASAVRADVAVPGQKRVPTAAILHLNESFQGTQLLVVCGDRVQPLKMLDPLTGRIEPFGGYYGSQPVKVCAIGLSFLPQDPKELTVEWLGTRKDVIWSPEIPVRWEWASVANPREETELHYRVERTPDGIRVTLTSLEGRDNWSSPLAIGACVASALAAGVMFVWLGWRAFRRRLTRTTPPPIQ